MYWYVLGCGGFTVNLTFLQSMSGQRSVTFDDSCSDTTVMSLQLPAAAAASAGDVSSCCCDEADTANQLSKYNSWIITDESCLACESFTASSVEGGCMLWLYDYMSVRNIFKTAVDLLMVW